VHNQFDQMHCKKQSATVITNCRVQTVTIENIFKIKLHLFCKVFIPVSIGT